MHAFDAVLERPEGTGTWTYVSVPLSVPEVFGVRGQVKVKATVNGVPFRGSLMPRGDGTHYLVVNKAVRDSAGVTQGDTVRVTVERDTEARTIAVPEDLQQALAANGEAAARFAALSYSHQKEYVDWIESARREETRQKRVSSAVERVLQGASPKSKSGTA